MSAPYIFLDIDGVCNSMHETPGSYLSHTPEEYGISHKNCLTLAKFADSIKAKIIIASNWRRFPKDGYWSFGVTGAKYKNPLPELRMYLGNRVAGDLPHDRHITKSEALELWFEDNGKDWKTEKYVIFDDDLREGYQSSGKFAKHFVYVNPEHGLTDVEVNKAKAILET